MVFALSWHRESYSPVQAPRNSYNPVQSSRNDVVHTQNNVAPARVRTRETMASTSTVASSTAPSRVVHAAATTPKSAPHEDGSTLLIGIDYPFEDGTVSVLSDSRVVYSQPLKGETKKRLGLFRAVEGRDLGTIHLATGEHQLGVHVQSSGAAYDELKTVAIEMGQAQT